MHELIIGVDIGGSKILSGILTREGRILARKKEPTLADRNADEITAGICTTIRELMMQVKAQREDILGIAVGAPGPLDYLNGIIKDPPQFKWREFPLRDKLSKRLDIQLLLENDANMAALGELYFGCSKGCRHLIYMTVSTGIGGGIIIDGSLYRGKDGGAGEFGRMIMEEVNNTFGSNGDLESLASGTAMAREAEKLIIQGQGHQMLALCSKGKLPTALEIGEAARQGDLEALEITQRAGYYIGMALANLVNVFNPERVVLGGGAGLGLQDLLSAPLREALSKWVAPSMGNNLIIEFTTLGEDIGLFGCAARVLLNNSMS